MVKFFTILLFIFFSFLGNTAVYRLGLKEAENKVLRYSNDLKSSKAAEDSAMENADAQNVSLYPKLTLDGKYQYNFSLPEFDIFGVPTIFGTPQNYIVGPTLTYTLWDTGSKRNTYESASLMASARGEDRKNAELQILKSVRDIYVQVQRGIEELRLTYESLELARAQDRDISNRYKNGAASKLDVVTSERSVLSYEIQFQKRQADLSLMLQDLFSQTGEKNIVIKKPGPPRIKKVSLILHFDSIKDSLKRELRKKISPPNENHPQLKSLDNQARSADLNSRVYKSKVYPTIQIYGAIYYTRPNFPNPINYWQEYAGVTLTMPLFFGEPAPKQAAEQKNLALATDYKRDQLRIDLDRDFQKVKLELESLNEQKILAEKDVVQSQKAAKLYYSAYKAGKVDILEVQNANFQALESKVSLTRIVTQILNNITLLKSLSGMDYTND